MTTNWNSLLSTKRNVSTVSNFANGGMTGKELVTSFAGTSNSSIVRSLLKNHGVDKSRNLAKKALYRRASSNV